jgi:hypothetical protein
MKKVNLILNALIIVFTTLSCSTKELPNVLTKDGAWCWFSDPRGVRADDLTFIGWINSDGDVVVSKYDHKTSQLDTTVVHEKLQKDDHNNPSVLVRNDGHVLVFYSKHNPAPTYLAISKKPYDISEWQPAIKLYLNDTTNYPKDYNNTYCYTNPHQLTAENNRIYNLWRGMGFKPNISYSDDGGQTWQPGKIVVHPEDVYQHRRPYTKVSSNSRDKMHFAFTDGHPRNETQNSVYYACYHDGAFFKADGGKITDYESLPFTPRQASLVYDATKTDHRAWVWDVAGDKNGFPVIVYARFLEETDHRYYYTRWDGEQWTNTELCASGKWFPQTPAGETEPEPHYSGGIILDHSDPSTVYLSREINGVFEIEKWTTKDNGKSWKSTAVTENSLLDNVRPFVVRNSTEGQGPHVVWMKNHRYLHYTNYQSELLWR